MRWSGIYGHDAIKEHLRRSLATGRVAHAYALVGPEGVGKRAVARLFAQALLCSGPEGGEPCGRCRACRQVEKGLHPDGHWIEPRDGTIGIDQVRELQRELALKPYEAERKTAVIDGADAMTTAAQNSLLKTLEEPAGHTVILLVASNPSALLPTVLSRCQVLRFQPLPPETVAAFLVDQGVSGEAARVAAALSGGSIARALAATSQDFLELRRRVASWVDALLDRSRSLRSVLLVGEELEKERERVEDFLNLFFVWLRDLLLVREGAEAAVANYDMLARLRQQASALRSEGLARALDEVERARTRLRANANFRLTVDVMLTNVQRSLAHDTSGGSPL